MNWFPLFLFDYHRRKGVRLSAFSLPPIADPVREYLPVQPPEVEIERGHGKESGL